MAPLCQGYSALSWSDRFEDPVPGCRTLRDAADYIQKLSKAEQQLHHWQAAIEALIMAAEGKGPNLHARVGMLRALPRQGARLLRSQGDALGKAEAKAGSIKRLPLSQVREL